MQTLYNYISKLKTLPKHGNRSDLPKGDPPPDDNISPAPGMVKRLKDLKEQFEDLTKAQAGNVLGIDKYIAKTELLGKELVRLQNASSPLERRNKSLTKTFNINTDSAAKLGQAFDGLAKKLGTGGLNIRKYAEGLNSIIPMQAKLVAGTTKNTNITEGYTEAMLETTKMFRENLGLSQESANSFQLFAASMGDGEQNALGVAAQLTSFVKPLEESTQLVGTTEAILGDISKLSADTQLNFGKYPADLGLAVMKARMLGTSLGEVFSIGKKMLNIEESVGAELQYQLLSGKRLVNQNGESLTQKLREATLSGNANDLLTAQNEILDTQGDEIKNNFMARQELAKMMGISEERLSEMYQRRQLLKDLGPDAEGVLELATTDFAAALNSFEDSPNQAKQIEALKSLMKNEANSLNTDEKILFYVEQLTTGLIEDAVKLARGPNQEKLDQSAIIAANSKAFLGEEGGTSDKNAVKSFITSAMALNGTLAKTIAQDNTAAVAAEAMLSVQNSAEAVFKVEGTILRTLTSGITKAFGDALSSISDLQLTGDATINIIGGADAKITQKPVQDFISRPGGELINFSSADTVVGAKPGGPIDQMLANSSPADTNTTSIDYSKLASAIKSGTNNDTINYERMAMAVAAAMKNVSIIAPPDIYADSKMNIRSIGT